MRLQLIVCAALAAFFSVDALSTTHRPQRLSTQQTFHTRQSPLFSAAAAVGSEDVSIKESKWDRVRREGGIFSIHTKYGGLNPFGLWYGVVAVTLGIPWYIAMTICQIFYKLTGERFDRLRRIPIFITQIWGTLLLRLTHCYPKMEGLDILRKFYKEGRCAMFVANHSSWMDIPYLGATIGWRNYKLISKKELQRVPILGKAIKVGGNILVDRQDRKSQLLTLKKGIQYLQDGVHLCTYPEGTRTRTGRLMPFKNGAFKMAHKAGAPVIPISIVGADKSMPIHWMFPYRPGHPVSRVVVHEPIESKGKTEEELAEAVRSAMISGLDDYQKPLDK
ncbi:1-acyl-sn-glycerol-3-phosphate acyltransferase [Fistulifera solaris]|uniref:1-acyl-sn-glycerol-3-phosphate acyltransferase n=1 Tax=Fistulifera solaris TaxID=1519565 RepID=A0A1Z5KQ64_FISSO|nr:1-acyl-sn-glycerol-3-phosphate acyltransferase [Fistulifera solaris]|eukprot:GAX28399.1 1-acyl-sn-glycerol-3-phosphate acyltransferase [Fistulifera solaris]